MSKKDQAPPRVRLAKHIDLTKAKPGCPRCNGRGVVGYKHADLGDGKGPQRIPIICRCVSRNDGVEPDELDRIMAEAKQQIDNGVFHENMAADLRRMPREAKVRAVAAFMVDVVNKQKSKEAKEAVEKTLELLSQDEDWPDIRSVALRILMRRANDPINTKESKKLAEMAMARVRQSMN